MVTLTAFVKEIFNDDLYTATRPISSSCKLDEIHCGGCDFYPGFLFWTGVLCEVSGLTRQ
jgi:hypothetical protein